MLPFLAGIGVAMFALGVWWIISRIVAILRVLEAHITRRAVALDPQYAYGDGDEEAPAE